jgi:hypothetical protein
VHVWLGIGHRSELKSLGTRLQQALHVPISEHCSLNMLPIITRAAKIMMITIKNLYAIFIGII